MKKNIFCTYEGVGVGVTKIIGGIERGSISRRLHDTASIFTAELYAIKVALILLKTSNNILCALYTDSLSAVQAIKYQSRHKIVGDILQLITQLKRRKIKIIMCWLPGHVNITGNEIADRNAKNAIKLNNISKQEIPPSDVKAYIKRTIYNKWNEDWKMKTKQQIKIREIYDDIPHQPVNLGLKRKDTTKIVRLQIGHTRLTHSNLLDADAEENFTRCIRCGETLTVTHLLKTCNHLNVQRRKFYNPQIPLKTLLTNHDLSTGIINFIKHIGLYYQL